MLLNSADAVETVCISVPGELAGVLATLGDGGRGHASTSHDARADPTFHLLAQHAPTAFAGDKFRNVDAIMQQLKICGHLFFGNQSRPYNGAPLLKFFVKSKNKNI